MNTDDKTSGRPNSQQPPAIRVFAAALFWVCAGLFAPRALAEPTALPSLWPWSGQRAPPRIDAYVPSSPSRGAAGGEPLTLEECVRLALKQNPANRSARLAADSAGEAVGEAAASYWPEVSLYGAYNRFRRYAFLPNQFSAPNMTPQIGPTDDWSAGIRARLLLFDSGRRPSQLRSAQARKASAQEESAAAEKEVTLRVHEAFFGLVAAQETELVAEENLARAEDHRKLARERKAAGAVPQADVLRAEVEVANARLALVRSHNAVRVGRGNLNTLLGQPVEAETNVAPQPQPSSPPDGIDLSEAFAKAVHARPELKAALHRIESARSAVDGARSAFGPKVLADGSYGRREPEFFPGDREWSAGISLEWPLFSGLSSTRGLARARAELAREEALVEGQVLEVRQEVWAAHSAWREAYEALDATGALVRDARESMRLSRERYQVGAGTVTDLLDAQTALARAEATRSQANWECEAARARFLWSIGELTAR